MVTPPRIVVLDRLAQGEAADPAAANLLDGQPQAWVANQYADASGQFFCGLWQGTGGRWRVRYTEHEFCVILEGRVRIESQDGECREFQAGDAFVVPAGFAGSWAVIGTCRKWYAVFEART
jgi:uncharacterized cupin superfamily protein